MSAAPNLPLYMLGAVTGRTSCSKPNLQQVPRREKRRREPVPDKNGRVGWLYGMPRGEASDLARVLRAGGVDAVSARSHAPLVKVRMDIRGREHRTYDYREQLWEVRGKGELSEAILLAAVHFARPSPAVEGAMRFSRRAWRRVLAGLALVLRDADAKAALEAAGRVGARATQLAEVYRHELKRVMACRGV